MPLEIVVNKTSKHPAFSTIPANAYPQNIVTNIWVILIIPPCSTSFSHWMKYETDVSLSR